MDMGRDWTRKVMYSDRGIENKGLARSISRTKDECTLYTPESACAAHCPGLPEGALC